MFNTKINQLYSLPVGKEMMSLVRILLFTYLGFTKSENWVPERSFNEFKEFAKREFKNLEHEIMELHQKLFALELKRDYSERTKHEFSAEADIADDQFRAVKVREFPGLKTAQNAPLSKLKRQQPENVAFYTYLSGKQCYGSHETFIFDVEEIDVGNGYNEQDGIFDAPITGVYVFTITLVPDFFKYVQAEIVINGVVKGNIFADSDEIHDIHPASTSIVVHVNAGDHVLVRRGTNSDCDVLSDTSHARTSFSGWFLF